MKVHGFSLNTATTFHLHFVSTQKHFTTPQLYNESTDFVPAPVEAAHNSLIPGRCLQMRICLQHCLLSWAVCTEGNAALHCLFHFSDAVVLAWMELIPSLEVVCSGFLMETAVITQQCFVVAEQRSHWRTFLLHVPRCQWGAGGHSQKAKGLPHPMWQHTLHWGLGEGRRKGGDTRCDSVHLSKKLMHNQHCFLGRDWAACWWGSREQTACFALLCSYHGFSLPLCQATGSHTSTFLIVSPSHCERREQAMLSCCGVKP